MLHCPTSCFIALQHYPFIATAIITPFGLFEYLITPFGLSNAAQTFQCMMDRIVSNLEEVFTFMDDSRVGSPDKQTHLIHLQALFTALAMNGLTINLEKCVFTVPTLEILGGGFDPHCRNRFLPSLPGYQAIAMFPRHGKVLLPFSSWLCLHSEGFNRSPEGQSRNTGVDCCRRRGFSKCKALIALRHFSMLPPMQSFLWPLTPPILKLEVSCSTKKQEAISILLVSYPKSCPNWNPIFHF
jgi:hypothetical protein